MTEYDYVAQVFADYNAVREGRKPLLIVSAGKSKFAANELLDIADGDERVTLATDVFVCEDGKLHNHLFIAAAGSPYAREAKEAIWQNIERVAYDGWAKSRAREDLQLRLGLLLGYSARECLDFIHSDLGRTCPCDCCGGPETAELPALVG